MTLARKEKEGNVLQHRFRSNERYSEYLKSPEWKLKCKAVRGRCNNICERCRQFLVDDVHHLTYERVFDEQLEDLQGLCAGCHEFVHEKSAIDPLQKSIEIKVTEKVIAYWDKQAMKFRRAKYIPKPSTDDKFRWQLSRAGIFEVPMDVFLDKQGKPVLDPSRWEKYRVASRLGRGWSGRYRPRGRPIPPDPQSVKAEIEELEKKKQCEDKRLRENPELFISYQGNLPGSRKEIVALFKKYPRLVDHGRECIILSKSAKVF